MSGAVILNQDQYDEVDFLKQELSQLEHYVQFRDSINTDVSQVGVAWHLDHSLKVINRVCDTLEDSDPEDYTWELNLTREAVFISGNMPRGRGKAPKTVLPPDSINTIDILAQIEEAQQKVLKIDALPKNAHFTHPVFGVLDKKGSKKFIAIHTHHHLSIIKDILQQPEEN